MEEIPSPETALRAAATRSATHTRARVHWQWNAFALLSPADLYAVLALRACVFVVEQQCAFVDPDGHDINAYHLLGWRRSRKRIEDLLAYLRVLPPGNKYAKPSIGRVITAPAVRGTGLGRDLMQEGIERTRATFGDSPIRIGAQQRLRRFYEGFGFVQATPPYDEDGIPHIEMLLSSGVQMPRHAL